MIYLGLKYYITELDHDDNEEENELNGSIVIPDREIDDRVFSCHFETDATDTIELHENNLELVNGQTLPTIAPADKPITADEYKKIIKVGDFIKVKAGREAVLRINLTSNHEEAEWIEGLVAKIDMPRGYFHLYNNKINGGQDNTEALQKGYRYVWAVGFDTDNLISIVGGEKTEPIKKTKKKKLIITLSKTTAGTLVELKVPAEIEAFFKEASGGKTKCSQMWHTKDGKPAEFYYQTPELEGKLSRLDTDTFSDFGHDLIEGYKVNVAILRTCGASKGVKLLSKNFNTISNAELQNYSTRLGKYGAKLWENCISKTKIKSIITFEI